ncbi:hypothetical protein Cenrod_1446 [Candidatus Symbiobacter mobilis CR]|uniref:Uncharacterized protein n=1 Tax=Candidatus Symbiobacter mobilis CR TaxID=946483 RepID=U5N811_9BURK|nr:hypothetical protein Cenrod_1446 [Candidatus Symbiobacter mobilis CR]
MVTRYALTQGLVTAKHQQTGCRQPFGAALSIAPPTAKLGQQTQIVLEPIPVGAAPSHCTRRRCSESSCTVSTFRFLRSGATHTASARLPTGIGSY